MPRTRNRELAAIATAIANRRLAVVDIAALRASIEALHGARIKQRTIRATLRDLKVAATQLKAFQARALGPLDDETLLALPPHLRRRMFERFDTVTARLVRVEAKPIHRKLQRNRATEVDPSFRCLHAYEAARAEPGASAFWCQLALVACLLSSVLQVLRQPGPR